MKRKLTFIALVAAAAVIAPVGPSAASDRRQDHHDLADGLVSPLHLAVGTNKSIYVTQDFAGKLSRADRNGTVEDIYQAPEGWSVAGVETRGATTFFLEGIGAGGEPDQIQGVLKAISPRGDTRTIANLAEYERTNNPDGGQQYGFGPGVSDECLKGWPAYPPPRYKGIIDSNPYATAVRGNTAYVADAAMNAILKVDLHTGAVSTLSVLPARPTVIPSGLQLPVDMMGTTAPVPECAVGKTYAFEPVPTDLEFGPDGWLYVTSLPGGPESPELGARGAVFKVNPWNGATKLWVDGILSATGLAVANTGDVYVASLFGNEILKFSAWKGHRSQFLAVNQPADVEIQGRTLYATVDALPGPPPGPGAAPDAPPPPPAGKVIKASIR